MAPDRFRRARRFLFRSAVAATTVGILAFLCFLPFAGRYLVAEDPLDHADVIFVLAGTRTVRWLEAVDLYREGRAPRILLSKGQVDSGELRLRQMRVIFPTGAELARQAMIQMHVPAEAVTIVSESSDNTAQEAIALHGLVARTGWQRLIIVTSKYHTRRAGFAFRREFRGLPIRVTIRASRYDLSKPERWWSSRSDIRFVPPELLKLLLYALGLGG